MSDDRNPIEVIKKILEVIPQGAVSLRIGLEKVLLAFPDPRKDQYQTVKNAAWVYLWNHIGAGAGGWQDDMEAIWFDRDR